MNNEESNAPVENTAPERTERKGHGGRNLLIMGFSAALIAFITTAASLKIYRDTGDVYLDRSRPGYIFEDEKHDTADDKKEIFPSDGEINSGVLDEYLKEYDIITERIEDASDDFSPESLSNDTLGIDEQVPEEDIIEENNF